MIPQKSVSVGMSTERMSVSYELATTEPIDIVGKDFVDNN